MDGTVGEFLYAGVSASSGGIISFLDDDDLFSSNKLEVVYNKFKSNNNICYYHNTHITMGLCVQLCVNKNCHFIYKFNI